MQERTLSPGVVLHDVLPAHHGDVMDRMLEDMHAAERSPAEVEAAALLIGRYTVSVDGEELPGEPLSFEDVQSAKGVNMSVGKLRELAAELPDLLRRTVLAHDFERIRNDAKPWEDDYYFDASEYARGKLAACERINAEQAVQLGRDIQEHKRQIQALEADDDIAQESAHIMAEFRRLRNELVVANTALAVRIANRFDDARMRSGRDDTLQDALAGLIRAAEKWDPDHESGAAFGTYAISVMEDFIKKGFRKRNGIINIPQDIGFAIYRATINNKERVESGNSRALTDEEIMESSGCKPHEVRRVRAGLAVPSVMLLGEIDDIEGGWGHSEGWSEEGLGTFRGRLRPIAGDPTPEQALERDTKETLHRLLEILDERESEVVRLRFGLGSEESLTLDEIGKRMHFSGERIRQIESRALAKLRFRANRDIAAFL